MGGGSPSAQAGVVVYLKGPPHRKSVSCDAGTSVTEKPRTYEWEAWMHFGVNGAGGGIVCWASCSITPGFHAVTILDHCIQQSVVGALLLCKLEACLSTDTHCSHFRIVSYIHVIYKLRLSCRAISQRRAQGAHF